MDAFDILSNVVPAGPYGSVTTLLEVLDDLDAKTRQRAALSLLNRMPDPDDEPESLPLRRLLLALMELSIADSVIEDFDLATAPMSQSVRHLRRLMEMREDADRRLAYAAHHVRPADLAALFQGVEREARAAGLHH